MNIPAFAFPAEAGTHLPTPKGWKAELALGGWLVTYRNKCPAPGIEPVAHLSTNRARRRLTSLIQTNAPTTTPDHQLGGKGAYLNGNMATNFEVFQGAPNRSICISYAAGGRCVQRGCGADSATGRVDKVNSWSGVSTGRRA